MRTGWASLCPLSFVWTHGLSVWLCTYLGFLRAWWLQSSDTASMVAQDSNPKHFSSQGRSWIIFNDLIYIVPHLLYFISPNNHKSLPQSRGREQYHLLLGECQASTRVWGRRATMVAIFENSSPPERFMLRKKKLWEVVILTGGLPAVFSQSPQKGVGCHGKARFSFDSLWPLNTLNILAFLEHVQLPDTVLRSLRELFYLILITSLWGRYRWLKKFSNLLKYMWLENGSSGSNPAPPCLPTSLGCYERYGILCLT